MKSDILNLQHLRLKEALRNVKVKSVDGVRVMNGHVDQRNLGLE